MVDRCVCHQVSFARIKARADELRGAGVTGPDDLLERLADELGCTTGCGLCDPYVRLTLRTSETRFDYRDPRLADA